MEIEFIYNQRKIIIEGNLNDKMKEFFLRFSIKTEKDLEKIYFLYNGYKINEDSTLKEISNWDINKGNAIQILVNDISNEDESFENICLKPSKYIICPQCKENIRICIDNYKIKLYECKNNDIIDNISFNDFENTQLINEKKIICQICKNTNKNDSYENKFYRCLSCKINLCPLCKSSHEKTHNIIDYDQKNFICNMHYEGYSSYCKDCKIDICLMCENEHAEHKIISYGRIMPNIKDLKEDINNQKEKISEFIKGIEDIINKLNKLIDNIDIFYKIYTGMIENYENKNRNYCILQNLIDMKTYNNNFYNNFIKINDEKNIIKKFTNLMDIYDKMTKKNNNINNKINLNDEKNQDVYNIENDKENQNTILNSQKNNNKDISQKEKIKENNNDDGNKIDKIMKKNSEIKNQSIKNNYEIFDLSKIKEVTNFKIEKKIKLVIKLKDDRIALTDENNKFYVFNFIKDNNCDINLDIQINNIKKIDLFDDSNLLIQGDISKLIKIKEKEIEVIQILEDMYDGEYKLYKFFYILTNKIIKYNIKPKNKHDLEVFFEFYSYENGKIINQKKSNIIPTDCALINNIYEINENEIIISYTTNGFLNIGLKKAFLFYDIKNNKKIKTLKQTFYISEPCIINKNYLIFQLEKKICLVDLTKRDIVKRISIDQEYAQLAVDSLIFSLNENEFLFENLGKYYQYRIEKDNIILKYKRKIGGSLVGKYIGNLLIIKANNYIYIYE